MNKKLIIGLGNPGLKFKGTRHNLGARVAMQCDGEVLETYMNDSGDGVVKLMRRNNLKPDDILIIYDDVELAFGEVKVKEDGSARGHNGVRSIIEKLGTDEFARLRLGIGKPETDLHDYVLGKFTEEEEKKIPEIIEQAKELLAVLSEDN